MTSKKQSLEIFDLDKITVDQIIDNLGSDLRDDANIWPLALSELIDVVADHFETKKKMKQEKAMEFAQDVITVIAHYHGGRNMYLPRDNTLKRALRDRAIYRFFNGSNHRELAKESRLTVAQIYYIIAKEHKRRKRVINQ